MTERLALTLACGDYEIVQPLISGAVRAEGIDLTILTRMDAATRHWRFLRNREFDLAEVSSSSYIMACDRGLPFAAIPVFLHRRFRHGFVFVNTTKGIRTPKDLIGRRIGVLSWQVSAILWIRGILEQEYGVPHKSIEWVSEIDEDIDFTPPPDLRLTRLPDDGSIEEMLAEGTLDAVLHSELIRPLLRRDPRVGRLFPDYRKEEQEYFRKTGIFPIMHVMGVKRDLVERHPWITASLTRAFDEAKTMAMSRMADPDLVPLAWYGREWEEQQALLGADPWEYGLTPQNRRTLETLLVYSYEQGLIGRRPAVSELFLEG